VYENISSSLHWKTVHFCFLCFQPTYLNERVIQETVTTSKTAYSQRPPRKMASLNNNLSELDTLLQDLSNAHYTGYLEKKGKDIICSLVLWHLTQFSQLFCCNIDVFYFQFK
jgi:hypothetical protein